MLAGGGRGVSRGAEGIPARDRAARLGDDTCQQPGNALARIGEREIGTARLEEAVEEYRTGPAVEYSMPALDARSTFGR